MRQNNYIQSQHRSGGDRHLLAAPRPAVLLRALPLATVAVAALAALGRVLGAFPVLFFPAPLVTFSLGVAFGWRPGGGNVKFESMFISLPGVAAAMSGLTLLDWFGALKGGDTCCCCWGGCCCCCCCCWWCCCCCCCWRWVGGRGAAGGGIARSTGDGVSRLGREPVRPRTRGEMVLGGNECGTRLRIAPLSNSCNASEDRLLRASCC